MFMCVRTDSMCPTTSDMYIYMHIYIYMYTLMCLRIYTESVLLRMRFYSVCVCVCVCDIYVAVPRLFACLKSLGCSQLRTPTWAHNGPSMGP